MTNKKTIETRLCGSCACGVANDDWTHLDSMGQEDSDDAMARIAGTMELMGWLSYSRSKDFGGYWNCELCDQVEIGRGEIFTREVSE